MVGSLYLKPANISDSRFNVHFYLNSLWHAFHSTRVSIYFLLFAIFTVYLICSNSAALYKRVKLKDKLLKCHPCTYLCLLRAYCHTELFIYIFIQFCQQFVFSGKIRQCVRSLTREDWLCILQSYVNLIVIPSCVTKWMFSNKIHTLTWLCPACFSLVSPTISCFLHKLVQYFANICWRNSQTLS